LEDGHDSALQPCSMSERDSAMGLASLGADTQSCVDVHSDKWTCVSVSGRDEVLTAAKIASRKRSNPGDRIEDLDGMEEVFTPFCCVIFLLLSVHYNVQFDRD
jgi:hypothetical protein